MQISLVQKASREAQRVSKVKVTSSEKSALLAQISGKNYADSQKHVAQFFDLPVLSDCKQKTSARPRKDKVPEDTPQKNFAAADVTTATTTVEASAVSMVEVKMPEAQPVEAKLATPMAVRSFSARQRKIVLKRQARCQHVDPLTNKQCQSDWFLQVDHKHSVWADGVSTLENAQTLCGPHNRLKYRKESGIKAES